MSDAMSTDTARLLTAAEQEAVNLTSASALAGLSRADLQALARRLREARDRARAIASQQRREMRGKSAPRGANPARDDVGTIAKEQVLADAVKRITEQLRHTPARPSGGPPAENRSKKAAAPRPASKEGVATSSKVPTVRSDPREVGRVSKSVMSAQARRDSKPR